MCRSGKIKLLWNSSFKMNFKAAVSQSATDLYLAEGDLKSERTWGRKRGQNIFVKGLFSLRAAETHTCWCTDDPPLYSVKNSGRQMMKAKSTSSKSFVSIALVMVTADDHTEAKHTSSAFFRLITSCSRSVRWSSENLLPEAFTHLLQYVPRWVTTPLAMCTASSEFTSYYTSCYEKQARNGGWRSSSRMWVGPQSCVCVTWDRCWMCLLKNRHIRYKQLKLGHRMFWNWSYLMYCCKINKTSLAMAVLLLLRSFTFVSWIFFFFIILLPISSYHHFIYRGHENQKCFLFIIPNRSVYWILQSIDYNFTSFFVHNLTELLNILKGVFAIIYRIE